MAELSTSVQIAYEADISSLQENLEKIPGITKKEASQMSKEMTKALRETEKATKKAAATNQKSMKKMQSAAKKTAKQFRSLKRGVSEMARGLGELAEITGGTDSKFGALLEDLALVGMAASGLMPLIGGLGAAITAMGTTAAVATGGLTLVAGGIAYAMGAFDDLSEEGKKQKEAFTDLSITMKEYNTIIDKSSAAAEKYQKKILDSKSTIEETNLALEKRLKTIMAQVDPSIMDDLEEMENKLALQNLEEKITKELDAQQAALTSKLKAQEDAVAATQNRILALTKNRTEEELRLLGLRKETDTLAEDIRGISILRNAKKFNEKLDEGITKMERINGLKIDVGIFKAGEKFVELSAQQLHNLKPIIGKYVEIDTLNKQIKETQSEINELQNKRVPTLTKIKNALKDVFLWEKEVKDLKAEEEKEAEEAAKREEKRRKARAWWAKEQARQKNMQSKINNLAEIEQGLIFETLDAREKIVATIEKERARIEKIKQEHDDIKKKKEAGLDISAAELKLQEKQARLLKEFEQKNILAIEQKITDSKNRQVQSENEILQKKLQIAKNSEDEIAVEKIKEQIYQAQENAIKKQIEEKRKMLAETQAEAKTEAELHAARQLELEIENEILTLEEKIGYLRLDNAKKVHNLELENSKMIAAGISQTFDLLQQGAGGALATMENMNSQNIEMMDNLFFVQQAASAAKLAMDSAQAIGTAMATLGPLGPLVAAGIAASTAAQMAAIMSQPAPSAKAHMGTTAPDERNMTLLKGEAVLDRTTVNRIGGAEGVQKLQEGRSSDGGVIVLQPFKHFDRYIRARDKRMPRKIAVNRRY